MIPVPTLRKAQLLHQVTGDAGDGKGAAREGVLLEGLGERTNVSATFVGRDIPKLLGISSRPEV